MDEVLIKISGISIMDFRVITVIFGKNMSTKIVTS